MAIKPKSILVLELLNSFSNREIERLNRFVRSSYFNTDQHVVRLFDFITRKITGISQLDQPGQLAIFKHIFPERKTSQVILSLLEKKLLMAKMGLLHKLIQRFLCIERLDQKPAFETELLNESLLEKKHYNMVLRKVNANHKTLKNIQEKGSAYYRFGFQNEQSLLEYLHHQNLLSKEDNLGELEQYLDHYYLLNKLNLYLTKLSLSSVSPSKNYDFSTKEATDFLIALPKYAKHPLIQVFKVTIDLIQTDNPDSYLQLLQLLEFHVETIPSKNLNDSYLIAANFCVRQIIKGKAKYNQHLFDLYKALDEKNMVLEDGFMPLMKLKNFVSIAVKMKDFAWAKSFIEKHRKNIQSIYQKSACHFNYGAIAFYQEDYETAIYHFIRVEYVSLSYKVNCRMMMLKAHYELDTEYDERTMRIFRSAIQFIRNQKELPTSHRKSFKNFVATLTALYRYRYKDTKKSLAAIQQKLDKFEFVSDRKWLLEKIMLLSMPRK